MSREPSESDKYFLEQLAGLTKNKAALEEADPGDVEPELVSAVVEQSAIVLEQAAELEESDATAEAGERAAELGRELREREEPSLARDIVVEVAESALSIGAAALISGGIAGPYIAMALGQEMAQKVIEATIGGAVGAFAGELTHVARGRRDRQRDAQLSELQGRLGRLEVTVGELAQREPDVDGAEESVSEILSGIEFLLEREQEKQRGIEIE